MGAEPLEYGRPRGFGTRQLFAALASLGTVRRLPVSRVRRTFLDTFDWRLFRRGVALEAVASGGEERLLWRELLGRPLRWIPAPAPRFARDLPEGVFRRHLEDVAEMRALLPVAVVATRSEVLELQDAGGKVLCRICVESHRTGDDARPLTETVRVEPVRGYDETLAAVRAALEALALPLLGADVLALCLAETGVTPADRSTKVRVALEPDLPALEAVRLVLRRLLETLEGNEAGTRDDVDSEFLHDFRVAVRRTRAALAQCKAVFPPKVSERFRTEFAWLGAVTTPTRDLDVHLLDFPRYRAALPPEVRPDLDPLFSFLQARQRREHDALIRALDSPRYRRLLSSWRAQLASTRKAAPGSPGARPIRELADSRLRKIFHRTLKEGRSLGSDSPAADFHELRKTCKKLRYLLEFFQSLYPAERVRPFVEALKGLQDNLGEYQDLAVQAEALRAWAGEMAAEGSEGARTHLAMGMLVEKLRNRQDQVRNEFSGAFRSFSNPGNVERFKDLFREGSPEEAAPP